MYKREHFGKARTQTWVHCEMYMMKPPRPHSMMFNKKKYFAAIFCYKYIDSI